MNIINAVSGFAALAVIVGIVWFALRDIKKGQPPKPTNPPAPGTGSRPDNSAQK